MLISLFPFLHYMVIKLFENDSKLHQNFTTLHKPFAKCKRVYFIMFSLHAIAISRLIPGLCWADQCVDAVSGLLRKGRS